MNEWSDSGDKTALQLHMNSVVESSVNAITTPIACAIPPTYLYSQMNPNVKTESEPQGITLLE